MTTDVPPTTSPAAATPDGPAPRATGAGRPSTSAQRYLQVQASDEFAGLRKSLRSFVFPMTAAFFLWYALYVLLSAYARGFMGIKLIGHINVALVFGLLQFLSTFSIAWYYAKYAEHKIDPVADKIFAELEEGAK